MMDDKVYREVEAAFDEFKRVLKKHDLYLDLQCSHYEKLCVAQEGMVNAFMHLDQSDLVSYIPVKGER